MPPDMYGYDYAASLPTASGDMPSLLLAHNPPFIPPGVVPMDYTQQPLVRNQAPGAQRTQQDSPMAGVQVQQSPVPSS